MNACMKAREFLVILQHVFHHMLLVEYYVVDVYGAKTGASDELRIFSFALSSFRSDLNRSRFRCPRVKANEALEDLEIREKTTKKSTSGIPVTKDPITMGKV